VRDQEVETMTMTMQQAPDTGAVDIELFLRHSEDMFRLETAVPEDGVPIAAAVIPAMGVE
jgi:hypothetical protein